MRRTIINIIVLQKSSLQKLLHYHANYNLPVCNYDSRSSRNLGVACVGSQIIQDNFPGGALHAPENKKKVEKKKKKNGSPCDLRVDNISMLIRPLVLFVGFTCMLIHSIVAPDIALTYRRRASFATRFSAFLHVPRDKSLRVMKHSIKIGIVGSTGVPLAK